MISNQRYKVLVFSLLFIFVSYLVIKNHNISYCFIPFFILALTVLEYKDFELRFLLLSFVFFISVLINKIFHIEGIENFFYNIAAFVSVFLFSFIKNYSEKKYIDEKEKNKNKISEIKKEIEDMKSKIDFYKKYKENIVLGLNSKQKILSCLKDIQSSKNNDEIVTALMKSILLLFPQARIDFIVSPAQSKIAGDVFKTLTSIYIPSISRETRYSSSDFNHQERSSVYLALSAFSKCIAVVKVYSEKEDFFSMEDFRVLEIFSATSSIAMENLSLYLTTEELARKDPLTGLFTHRAFEEKLDEEILVSARTKKPLSLIIFDIDHFKHVNDTYGHQAGDDVLKKIASAALSNVREFDFVARYGGEEFAVIMPQTSKNEAVKISASIREAVKSLYFESDGKSFKITISMGVAEFPSEATSKNQIIRVSDERLYRAKRDGRDRIIYE